MTHARARRTTLTALPFLALLAAGPAAHANTVDGAAYTGSWASRCTLPITAEGPQSGPYTCNHTAASVACASVVDTDNVTASAYLCRANLVSGKTTGHADLRSDTPFPTAWTCANGSGTGSFAYQPSTTSSTTFVFPVVLSYDPKTQLIQITGSYVQSGSGRTIAVDAVMPGVCSVGASAPSGYEGTVAP